jgi:hypothetical protein
VRARFILRRYRSARAFNRRRRLRPTVVVSGGVLRGVRIRLRRGRRIYASRRLRRLSGRHRIKVPKRRAARRARYRLTLVGRDDIGRRVIARAVVRFSR